MTAHSHPIACPRRARAYSRDRRLAGVPPCSPAHSQRRAAKPSPTREFQLSQAAASRTACRRRGYLDETGNRLSSIASFIARSKITPDEEAKKRCRAGNAGNVVAMDKAGRGKPGRRPLRI